MTWYERTLRKYKKELISGAIFSVVLSLALLLWVYLSGYSFEWREISPIDPPSLFSRIVYSALTYVTLGAILYNLLFYKFLYHIAGDYRSFVELKRIVWVGLMALMFFVIVPKTVDMLNAIISFGFNIFNLLLYLFPPFGVSLILFLIYLYFRKGYRAV